MTDGQRERLRRERRDYGQSRRGNSQNNADHEARIAQLETRIEELTANIPQNILPDHQTQISQVSSTGTRGSIYGGRSRQQQNRNGMNQE